VRVRARGRAGNYGYEVSDPNHFAGELTWLAGQAAGDWGRDERKARRAPDGCGDARRQGRSIGRFAGRGPKGYRRADARVREDVCDRLTADPALDASEITVDVDNLEVTLSGSVPDRDTKRAAEDCAEDVPGVREVHNLLHLQ
jgi:osmotically-inducible protein OsmY